MEKVQDEKWARCLHIFQDNLPAEQFESWFKPIVFLNYDESTGKLVLGIPSEFFKEHLEGTYKTLLIKTLRHVYGESVNLHFSYMVVKDQPDTTVTMPESKRSAGVSGKGSVASPFVKQQQEELDSQLNPKYNFENYVVGECNNLAATIGKAICKNPKSQTYNPLFVFGPPGVGKTHLAQAIGIGLKESASQRRVLYVTARLFEAQFTTAMSKGRVNDFMDFYQGIDTLIIDDIQDFIGKAATQRQFFHIFNHLHLNGKQLILTSDVRPSEMDNMEERLLSRFKWGMTCELFRPDYEMRYQVLKTKAEQDGLDLPNEVIDYIAQNCNASFRELEGIMVSLMAHATITCAPINIDLAKQVLKNAVKIKRHTINFEMIAEKVCSYYNIDEDQLFTKSRKRDINDARQLVMYMTKKLTNLPLTAIGARLSRTHATVLHAVSCIESRLAMEAQLRQDLAAIESALK